MLVWIDVAAENPTFGTGSGFGGGTVPAGFGATALAGSAAGRIRAPGSESVAALALMPDHLLLRRQLGSVRSCEE